MQRPDAASTVTSGVQSQFMAPVDSQKLMINRLIETKATMFHLYRMLKPHMNIQAAIKNSPAMKIVRRPKPMIINIAISAVIALTAPITQVPWSGVRGKLAPSPAYSSILTSSLLAQILIALIPLAQLKIHRKKQTQVAFRYFLPHAAQVKEVFQAS